ncbi:MAG: hypothetical protein WB586_20350, partial [Chthoniobacterales bacterium]
QIHPGAIVGPRRAKNAVGPRSLPATLPPWADAGGHLGPNPGRGSSRLQEVRKQVLCRFGELTPGTCFHTRLGRLSEHRTQLEAAATLLLSVTRFGHSRRTFQVRNPKIGQTPVARRNTPPVVSGETALPNKTC